MLSVQSLNTDIHVIIQSETWLGYDGDWLSLFGHNAYHSVRGRGSINIGLFSQLINILCLTMSSNVLKTRAVLVVAYETASCS